MELFRFKNNNKEYVYFLYDDQLMYGCKKNGKISFINKEEEKLMDDMFFKLVSLSRSLDWVKGKKICYNGKNFQEFADKRTNKKYVYEVVNEEYKLPVGEDFEHFYKKNDKNCNKNKCAKIKKNKKIRAYVGLLSLMLGVSSLKLMKSNFVPMIMERAIENNDNLTNDEKQFMLPYVSIIKENIEYIDIFEVQNNLKNVDIKYIDSLNSTLEDNNISGYYSHQNNELGILNCDGFQNILEDDDLKSTLDHETSHLFSPSGIIFGYGLKEAANEIISREYAQNVSNNLYSYKYFDECICLYSLAEIVGVDSFKSLHFECDYYPLISDLTSIIDDKDMAVQLIHQIDSIDGCYKNMVESRFDIEKYTQYVNEYNELKKQIYNKIKLYFETKYGYDMAQDETMKLYLNYSGFVNNTNFVNYDKGIEHTVATKIIPKGYFSNDYINKHSNIYYDAKIQYYIPYDLGSHNISDYIVASGTSNIAYTDNLEVNYHFGQIIVDSHKQNIQIITPNRQNNLNKLKTKKND